MMFQSAPAITGGRSTSSARTPASDYCFNPRPPSLAGDPRAGCCNCQHGKEFQSAPAITGGRSGANAYVTVASFRFQSAPAITGGRSTTLATDGDPEVGFNPRPPSLAGDPRCGCRNRCRP